MPKQRSSDESGTASEEPKTLGVEASESFRARVVHRRELKNAPYNPRVIGDAERRKLRRLVKKWRLLAPITWNARSGNIVGGHQRVAALDAIHGTDDYELTVAAVDLDDAQEKAANVALNNYEAQGTWDMEKLGALVRDQTLELTDMGFDVADVYQIFGDAPMVERSGAAAELADTLREVRERQEQALANLRVKRDGSDFYLVVVFRDNEDCLAFVEKLGLPSNRYVDGRELRRRFEER